MSAIIDILTEGYANLGSNEEERKIMYATGSCALVRANGLKVLFDTMGPWERDKLIASLAALKIHPTDIDYLVCSHSHPDHVGNLNLFLDAKHHTVGTSVYRNDVYDLTCFEPIGDRKIQVGSREIDYIEYEPYKLTPDVAIHHTPGHTMECVSLVVDNCEHMGKVGLVGDLFERREDMKDESIWLSAGSQNSDLQRAHRMRIFKMCDYIMPGHGKIFDTSTEIFNG